MKPGWIEHLDMEHDPRLLPKRLVRVASGSTKWGLPRRFEGYEAVSQERLSVRGAAPKFILRCIRDESDWYIVKLAEKFGAVETLTELLNNLIGGHLGFPVAHAGILRADGNLCFASRNFQQAGETLIHGSLLVRQTFGEDLGNVGKKKWDEQRTYDLELIKEMLASQCDDIGGGLFGKLLEMIVFDALIGSMDRHMQNWGLLATVEEPRAYRFAPIFDSARALLWNQSESKLEILQKDPLALEGYMNRAQPVMGCVSTGKAVNHFGLVEHIFGRYPVPVRAALNLVTPERVSKVVRILGKFPFHRDFSGRRRVLIAKVLALRAEKLYQIALCEGRR